MDSENSPNSHPEDADKEASRISGEDENALSREPPKGRDPRTERALREFYEFARSAGDASTEDTGTVETEPRESESPSRDSSAPRPPATAIDGSSASAELADAVGAGDSDDRTARLPDDERTERLPGAPLAGAEKLPDELPADDDRTLLLSDLDASSAPDSRLSTSSGESRHQQASSSALGEPLALSPEPLPVESQLQNDRPTTLQAINTVLFHVFTVLCSLVFVVAILSVIGTYLARDDALGNHFERPVETTLRVFERDLFVAEILFGEVRPELLTLLTLGAFSSRDELLNCATEKYRLALVEAQSNQEVSLVRARLAVLLAEARRMDEANDVCRSPDYGGELPAEFLRCFDVAYGRSARLEGSERDADDALLSEDDYGATLSLLHPREFADTSPAWSTYRLQRRLAEATQRPRPAIDAERARQLVWNLSAPATYHTMWLYYGSIVLGLVAVLVWLCRRCPSVVVAAAPVPPNWTFYRGYGVFVRTVAAIAVIALGLGYVMQQGSADSAVLRFLCPLAILFTLILMEIHFGRGQWILTQLGLNVGSIRWNRLLLVTFAVFAIDQIGTLLIVVAMQPDYSDLWSDGATVLEVFLWNSPIEVLASCAEIAVGAPILEELICRGLIYATLRRAMRPSFAAVLSAIAFSVPHIYSLPGLLVIFWTGLVLAYTYEKTRSLLPCILVHAMHNGIICFAMATGYTLP